MRPAASSAASRIELGMAAGPPDEHEEIATYTAIESLARSVGDKETAMLAHPESLQVAH